jgi:hypothetical protein
VAIVVGSDDEFRIKHELGELNSAFTHHLDHGNIEELIGLFCDDALYTHGSRRSEGKQAIERLFRDRAAGIARTSRHIASGLRLQIVDLQHATGTSVCLTFAADGLPPLPATPLLVADFIDTYILCPDRRWRFKTRHIQRIFVDPSSTGPVGGQD